MVGSLGGATGEICAHLEDAAEERLGENGKNFGRHKAGL
jgi:hypothetical protein